ncbi:YrzI family small protein [Evansella halocellulosilytica]|nr:YrzI family small protein [Evansella halocellulosilytica]
MMIHLLFFTIIIKKRKYSPEEVEIEHRRNKSREQREQMKAKQSHYHRMI